MNHENDLRGEVQFLTGGNSPRPMAGAIADLVQFQSRQYSLDERRYLNSDMKFQDPDRGPFACKQRGTQYTGICRIVLAQYAYRLSYTM